MREICFEWDDKKNRSNQLKHDVSFEEAVTVFYDENAIEYYDFDHSQKEERLLLLGLSTKLKILLICHCYRKNDNIIRIISARKATKNEKQEYMGEQK